MEIQMLVLMPIPRVHAVEEMGWESEDPISFFQPLLPTYYFIICRTFNFSMPHLLPHDSVSEFHRWELPYTSTNYFHFLILSSFRIFTLNARITEKHYGRPGNALPWRKARHKCCLSETTCLALASATLLLQCLLHTQLKWLSVKGKIIQKGRALTFAILSKDSHWFDIWLSQLRFQVKEDHI